MDPEQQDKDKIVTFVRKDQDHWSEAAELEIEKKKIEEFNKTVSRVGSEFIKAIPVVILIGCVITK